MKIIETFRDGDNFRLRAMDDKGNVLYSRASEGEPEEARLIRHTTLAIIAVLKGDCVHFHNQPGAAEEYLKFLNGEGEEKCAEPGESCDESTQGKDCDPGGWNAETIRGLEEEITRLRG